MATQGSFTIGGTSPDYATIQAWADSPTGNLTGVYEGKLRAGAYGGATINTGFTTTATEYMKLTYDTGAHHGGVIGDGAYIDGAINGDYYLLLVQDQFVRIEGIGFTQPIGGSSEAIHYNPPNTTAGELWVEECLCWGLNQQQNDFIYMGTNSENSDVYISNCFGMDIARVFLHIQGTDTADGSNFYVYNCTGIDIGSAQQCEGTDRGGILSTGESTVGRTVHAKNCYFSVTPVASWMFTPNRESCYLLEGTNDSWGNSTNNAASDTTAPGTNPQNSLTQSSQLVTFPLVETIGDDDAAAAYDYDCGENRDVATMDRDIPSSTVSGFWLEYDSADTPPQTRNALIRMDLSNFPAAARVYRVLLKLTTGTAIIDTGKMEGDFYLMNRNWTTSATWNTYDGTNSWATAGGLGAADRVEAAGTASHQTAPQPAFDISTSQMVSGDTYYLNGNRLPDWVQDAIDGNGQSPVGANYLDMMILLTTAGADNDQQGAFDFAHGTVIDRPHFEIRYHTAGNEPDWRPDAAGSLDGNGTNLSSDGDYPISTDATGLDRSGWDIGAFAVTTLSSQNATQDATIDVAGVAYDAVLDPGPEQVVQDATVDVAGAAQDATLLSIQYAQQDATIDAPAVAYDADLVQALGVIDNAGVAYDATFLQVIVAQQDATIDVAGEAQDAVLDPGAAQLQQDATIDQAGVAFDGTLVESSQPITQDATIDVAGVAYDATLTGSAAVVQDATIDVPGVAEDAVLDPGAAQIQQDATIDQQGIAESASLLTGSTLVGQTAEQAGVAYDATLVPGAMQAQQDATIDQAGVALDATLLSILQILQDATIDVAGLAFDAALAPGALEILQDATIDAPGVANDGALAPGAAPLLGTVIDVAGTAFDAALDPGLVTVTQLATIDVVAVAYDGVVGAPVILPGDIDYGVLRMPDVDTGTLWMPRDYRNLTMEE